MRIHLYCEKLKSDLKMQSFLKILYENFCKRLNILIYFIIHLM